MAEEKSILDLASELIRLKKTTSDQLERMRILKERIKPYVKANPLKLSTGTLFYVDSSSSTYVKKDKLQRVLMETFKLSPETATRIIELGAAKKIINAYVKITTE